MRISMDAAAGVAKRVNDKLGEWDIPITVRPNFIIMVSLVIKELRLESRKDKEQ